MPRYTVFMFGISGSHLLILTIVLLIFGPKRLPELGNTLGKAMRNFKDGLSGVQDATFTRLGEVPNPYANQPGHNAPSSSGQPLAGQPNVAPQGTQAAPQGVQPTTPVAETDAAVDPTGKDPSKNS